MRKRGEKHKLRIRKHWLCGEKQLEGNYFKNAVQLKEEISYLGKSEILKLSQVADDFSMSRKCFL